MKEEIFNNIVKLLEAGYEVRLSKTSIQVVEIYKSQSRDKWIEKEVGGSFSSFNYWSEGALHISASYIKKYTDELVSGLLGIKEKKKIKYSPIRT